MDIGKITALLNWGATSVGQFLQQHAQYAGLAKMVLAGAAATVATAGGIAFVVKKILAKESNIKFTNGEHNFTATVTKEEENFEECLFNVKCDNDSAVFVLTGAELRKAIALAEDPKKEEKPQTEQKVEYQKKPLILHLVNYIKECYEERYNDRYGKVQQPKQTTFPPGSPGEWFAKNYK